MRYKVYAGRVAVDFKNSLGTQTARFHWTEKVLVYDSYGDSIEGEETDGILAEPEVELENKAAGTFSCLVPYQVETRFGTIKNPYYSNFPGPDLDHGGRGRRVHLLWPGNRY